MVARRLNIALWLRAGYHEPVFRPVARRFGAGFLLATGLLASKFPERFGLLTMIVLGETVAGVLRSLSTANETAELAAERCCYPPAVRRRSQLGLPGSSHCTATALLELTLDNASESRKRLLAGALLKALPAVPDLRSGPGLMNPGPRAGQLAEPYGAAFSAIVHMFARSLVASVVAVRPP